MALLRKFFNQTRKPEGFLGKLMLSGMNSGHAKLADWGFEHLPELTVSQAVDLGCGGGRNAGELLKKYPAAQKGARGMGKDRRKQKWRFSGNFSTRPESRRACSGS